MSITVTKQEIVVTFHCNDDHSATCECGYVIKNRNNSGGLTKHAGSTLHEENMKRKTNKQTNTIQDWFKKSSSGSTSTTTSNNNSILGKRSFSEICSDDKDNDDNDNQQTFGDINNNDNELKKKWLLSMMIIIFKK